MKFVPPPDNLPVEPQFEAKSRAQVDTCLPLPETDLDEFVHFFSVLREALGRLLDAGFVLHRGQLVPPEGHQERQQDAPHAST